MANLHYHAGYNMPGYLPEMEPITCETFDEGRDFLLGEMDRYCDCLIDSDDMGIVTEMDEAIDTLRRWNMSQYGDVVGNIAYWIEKCSDNCDMEGE